MKSEQSKIWQMEWSWLEAVDMSVYIKKYKKEELIQLLEPPSVIVEQWSQMKLN